MSIKYNEYLAEHRHNVLKGYQWIRDNVYPVIPEGYPIDEDKFFTHDESKFDEAEYDAYDAYFYGGNRSYKVVKDFEEAWLHHIHHNPHHWQHWVLINDEPGEGMKILEMPYDYVIEMICDWWAFSWAKGNLHEIFSWYDEHKEHMKLHPDTRALVESILNLIKIKLEEIENA